MSVGNVTQAVYLQRDNLTLVLGNNLDLGGDGSRNGTGKTTLIKEICNQLGVLDSISSPTFSLVNEYNTSNKSKVFHFDFYRIENEEEALDIGIEEYFDTSHWCFVEWPENIENLLPLDVVQIHLSILDVGQRTIQIK